MIMAMKKMLEPQELERYDRQIMIPGFGIDGQVKLKEARVLIAGAGGLGCPAATYLTAAGVGEIRIVDFDRVALSNLNRQVLHWEKDLGKFKVHSVSSKLSNLNSTVTISGLTETITEKTVVNIISGTDIILDALDNFQTRLVLNQGAVSLGIPLVYGGINGFVGMTTTIIPYETPCLNCIFPNPIPQEKFPVLGTTPAVIACIQATEVIKFLLGLGSLLKGRLLIYDGEVMRFNEVALERDPACPVCGHRSSV
jgi:molybdopterin/thiamine biosynthesis adenylyltransferase